MASRRGSALSGASDGGALLWDCPQRGLAPTLVRALEAAAAELCAAGHPPLRVASGRRTLRRQAELMAAMTPAQLRGLYARNGTPDYVERLLAFPARHGRAPSAADAYAILRTRREGFISAHLCGAAVDLEPPAAPAAEAVRACLERHGFELLDERSVGIACLHARLRALPCRIVRR
jgi:hypothetical protein